MTDGAVIAVTGASGNVGTALLRALVADDRVGQVRAVARRPPERGGPGGVRWFGVDITTDRLEPVLDGADAVVHLAWRIQPSWDLAEMRRTNVEGSARVFAAAEATGTAIVHGSSLGAYGPGPKDELVGESWALGGHRGHPYSVQKAEVEELLDRVEQRAPELRVARVRPCLVFQAAAGQELRRYFLPRHAPFALARPELVDRVPARFQVAHADDVARAFAEVALRDVRGAFNVATRDVVGGRNLAALDGPGRVAAWALWRPHLQPVDPGWVRLVLRSPLVDPGRAERELDWQPTWSGHDALADGLAGIRHPPVPPTPALAG